MVTKKKTTKKKKTAKTGLVTRNVFQDGPHLITAVLCEKVLEEKNGVKTVIRMVDRFTVSITHPEAPEHMPKIVRDLALLVKLKKGDRGDKHEMRIDFVKPSGEVASSFTNTLTFEGGPERGIDLVANVRLEFDADGLYWFDLFIDGIRVTRLPMRVIYIIQRQLAGGEPPKSVH
ncbi:hypothetical protein MYX65_12915 [Acidobacteria bacterium AH-259-L09]|nr:hypothetical protein [Acidobacteria bacterium AH-259-L09]